MESSLARQEPNGQLRSISKAAAAILVHNAHFRRRAEDFDFEYVDGVLIVEGIVPSFYLKQLLQRLLRDLDDVQKIDNRVRVVCNVGLSSTHKHELAS